MGVVKEVVRMGGEGEITGSMDSKELMGSLKGNL